MTQHIENQNNYKTVLGIDIGGSGIKGAPIDITKPELLEKRHRIETPQPSKPEAVADCVTKIVDYFGWKGPIGCTFPAVIRKGVSYTAANVDKSWIGFNGQELITEKTGCPVLLINDADAAGYAEIKYGAGKDKKGTVIMLTFGTGIGSAIFTDGHLVRNTEFGHLIIRGKEAEHRASDKIRKEKDLSYEKWSKTVTEFLLHMEALFFPDLFIFGGGVSKKHHKFFDYLDIKTKIVPAQMLNEAGIIGAACAAADML